MTFEKSRSLLAGGHKGSAEIKKAQFPPLPQLRAMEDVDDGLSHLEDVQIEISAELGRATMKVKQLLGLAVGSIIKLDKTVGDPVDVILNQQPFARGEVVIINDAFGIRIGDIDRVHYSSLYEGLI